MLRDEMWDDAVRAVRGDAHGLVSTREDLVERWSEGHRGYHDLRHLDEVLAALSELRGELADDAGAWASVVFAAWFHDAVYAVENPEDNERHSADLAREALSHGGVGADVVDATVALVEATVAHDTEALTGADAAFHDADLWILSAPTERFDDYCADVRREYASVPDAAYAAGRTAILRPFVNRPWVYRTEHARRVWESRARANLTRELARLAPGSGHEVPEVRPRPRSSRD